MIEKTKTKTKSPETKSHQDSLLWRRFLSYRNQFVDLQSKSLDWFLHDRHFRHEELSTDTPYDFINKFAYILRDVY